jgi:hypothetical protein
MRSLLLLQRLLLLLSGISLLVFFAPVANADAPTDADVVEGFFSQGGHTNNWAVLVIETYRPNI